MLSIHPSSTAPWRRSVAALLQPPKQVSPPPTPLQTPLPTPLQAPHPHSPRPLPSLLAQTPWPAMNMEAKTQFLRILTTQRLQVLFRAIQRRSVVTELKCQQTPRSCQQPRKALSVVPCCQSCPPSLETLFHQLPASMTPPVSSARRKLLKTWKRMTFQCLPLSTQLEDQTTKTLPLRACQRPRQRSLSLLCPNLLLSTMQLQASSRLCSSISAICSSTQVAAAAAASNK